jgi:hypothetical protein
MESIPVRSVLSELTDFLATNPTPEEIIAYRFPDELIERAHHLLDLNGEGNLTPEEHDEMMNFAQMENMLMMLVAKTKLKLRKATE